MSKYYYLEAKLGPRWTLIEVFTRQNDAMHEVSRRAGERYPMRIIRVIRTVVFEGK